MPVTQLVDKNGQPIAGWRGSPEGDGYVADVGIASVSHNRFLEDIGAATATAVSVANPTQVTIPSTKYEDGDWVVISGSDSTPSIDGSWEVTKLSDTAFTIPIEVTGAGTTATVDFIKRIEFSTADDKRDYLAMATRSGGASTDYLMVCEDPVNLAQAVSWLTQASNSSTSDVMHWQLFDKLDAPSFANKPRVFSQIEDDLSLTRIAFRATAGVWTVEVGDA